MVKSRTASSRVEPVPAPQPLPVPVPDNHTHLDLICGDRAHDSDLADGGAVGGPAAVLAAAEAVGVDRVVQVATDVSSSRWAVELAERDHRVLAAVAVHPNEAPHTSDLDEALRVIDELAGRPRVRAIGETGLDTFRTGPAGRARQEASFRAHIAIAKRHGKALMIHDRDAHADVLRVLDEEGAPDRVVLHCFSGDVEFARQCVRRGYALSFAGTVTFKNAPYLREAAMITPLDQMMVETDAPFLAPAPFRGRLNAPYLIPVTVRALAEVLKRDLGELCAALSATTERIYGPWPV